ncbi:MAG: hypothetical protein GXO61_04990 [Epsilonproteobacteria bacterium]|nr:hypothetical protein [Campylobacterota bacterium]
MFKSFLTAISAVFFSNQSPTIPTIQNATLNQSYQQPKSYFFYVSPSVIDGKLYVGRNEGIVSNDGSVKKVYSLNARVDSGSCAIASSTFDQEIDITNKEYIDFEIVFKTPCRTDVITVSGEKRITNEVFINGQLYTSTKTENFGPVRLFNNVNSNSYTIKIKPSDGERSIKQNSVKTLYYKITNPQGEEISSSHIKALKIRSLDSEKLLLLLNDDTLVSEISLEPPISSFGSVVVRSLSTPGEAKISIKALIEGDNFDDEISSFYSLEVEPLPIRIYEARLNYPQNYVKVGEISSIEYTIYQNKELVPSSQIKNLEFTIGGGVFVLGDGSETTHYTPPFFDSAGSIYFKATNPQDYLRITLKVTFQDGTQKITSLKIAVGEESINKFNVDYVGTRYDEELGLFVDTYSILSLNPSFSPTVKVDVITPKILYPKTYYDDFLKGKLDFNNPNVFYEDIYYEMLHQQPSGEFISYSSTIFKTSRFDLRNIIPGEDKLLILPNRNNPNKTIIGAWEIANILDRNRMLLQQTYPYGSKKGLSFVIGNNTRYNVAQDTIAMMRLDHPLGVYELDEKGMTKVEIYYPSFMAGKDMFISVTAGEGKDRVGNVYKRTLTGTELTSLQPEPCKSSVCIYRLKLYFAQNRKPYQYANFAVRCSLGSGSLRKPLKFTTYYELTKGGDIDCDEALHSQKVDWDGKVYICIYPKEVYKEVKDPETNETSPILDGYEEVSVSCTYNVAEEFGY